MQVSHQSVYIGLIVMYLNYWNFTVKHIIDTW